MDLSADNVYPYDTPTLVRFAARRSVVHSTGGMVACSQPLAAEAGQRILKQGGNAADAAVAVAAALNMTEPASTGAGGDMFCLYFDAAAGTVHALNGSGRSPGNTSLESVQEQIRLAPKAPGIPGRIPFTSALAVTVPGAPAGWLDAVELFGSGMGLDAIFAPAIELGERGFPVSEISAKMWHDGEALLKKSPYAADILKADPAAEQGCRAPRAGEILHNPALARTLRTLAAEGKAGFYRGRIAAAIVDAVAARGGHLSLADLEDHLTRGPDQPAPLSLPLTSPTLAAHAAGPLELWEHPPNGQGLVALMALGILQALEADGTLPAWGPADHNTAAYLHALIEALRLAFGDAAWWVTDPERAPVDPAGLLDPVYLQERARLLDPTAARSHAHGTPGTSGTSPALNHSDTVYFAVTDAAGNAMSFINSNFREFGSGILPSGCGFVLQNRGAGFNLAPAVHPNVYAPRKRPYHTIIPGLVTVGPPERRRLHSLLGVMGGLMQPQGHVQVLLNMERFGMNPQQALDAPRICLSAASGDGGPAQRSTVFLEEGIAPDVVAALRDMGHDVRVMTSWDRVWFGRGQVIRRHVDGVSRQTVWSGGSDGRGDGCAMPA